MRKKILELLIENQTKVKEKCFTLPKNDETHIKKIIKSL
jgi:hypothetical protein